MRGRRQRPQLHQWLVQEAHIEVADDDFLALDATLDLSTRFIDHLRAGVADNQVWPLDEPTVLEQRLVALADIFGETRVVWLHKYAAATGAILVPFSPVVRQALKLFVTREADLMLTTGDVTDGLCIELNQMPHGDEYEWSAWGAFAKGE